jgi:hypothetical protein
MRDALKPGDGSVARPLSQIATHDASRRDLSNGKCFQRIRKEQELTPGSSHPCRAAGNN